MGPQEEHRGCPFRRTDRKLIPASETAPIIDRSSPAKGRALEASCAWGGERRLPVPGRSGAVGRPRTRRPGTTTGLPYGRQPASATGGGGQPGRAEGEIPSPAAVAVRAGGPPRLRDPPPFAQSGCAGPEIVAAGAGEAPLLGLPGLAFHERPPPLRSGEGTEQRKGHQTPERNRSRERRGAPDGTQSAHPRPRAAQPHREIGDPGFARLDSRESYPRPRACAGGASCGCGAAAPPRPPG